MTWTEPFDNSSIHNREANVYELESKKGSATCVKEAYQPSTRKSPGTAWNEYNREDVAATQTLENHFPSSHSILPPDLSAAKPKKKDLEPDYAATNYVKGSDSSERAAEQRAAQPRLNGNRFLQEEQARDAVRDSHVGSLPVLHLEQSSSTAQIEAKSGGLRVADRHSQAQCDAMHCSNDSISTHLPEVFAHVSEKTQRAISSNEESHYATDGRRNDFPRPEEQSKQAGLDTITHHGQLEQSVSHSFERNAGAEKLKESLVDAHGTHQSAQPSLQPTADMPLAHNFSASHNVIVDAPPREANLRGTVPNEGHLKEHVFSDPRVMAQNDGFDIHRNAMPESRNAMPDSRKPESAIQPEILHKSETCEPNRTPCGRSLGRRDETTMSAINDYKPSNLKAQPSEASLSNRQHSVNQADSAVLMENARKAAGQRSESGTNYSGGGTAGGRVKQEKEPGASIKNATGRSDGVGMGSKTASASKQGERAEQSAGARGVRKGFHTDTGTAIQNGCSDTRNGQKSINGGKRGEKVDAIDNSPKNGSFTGQLISAIRTVDWSSIGKWVSAIRIDRWIDHWDWKIAGKLQGDFGLSRRNDDGSKGTGIGGKSARESQGGRSEGGNNNATEQVATAKRTASNGGPAVCDSGDVAPSVKDVARINNINRSGAAAAADASHPTAALKQLIAKVEAEERKWDTRLEPRRTEPQQLGPRQVDRRFEVLLGSSLSESGERGKIYYLPGKLVPSEVEVVKSSQHEGDAVHQSWRINFTVSDRRQERKDDDDEEVTFKREAPSSAAPSSQQNQQSQSQTMPMTQAQNRTQYVIQTGDTLRSIACRLFADPRIADLILNLNRHLLTPNFDLPLRAGIVLRLPTQIEIQAFYHFRRFAGSKRSV